MRKLSSNKKRRGAVLLLVTLAMVFVLPIIGLAVDVTLLYMIKTRLSAAVDGGALAAARSLSRGVDLASQTTAASNTAVAYFRANFPQGYLMTPDTSPNPTVLVDASVMNLRTVTIDATVQAPMYFLRLLGFTEAPVRAYGQASRRDVNIVLVLDRSGSLQTSGYCDDLIDAATKFSNKFAEGRDNLGLVTFARSSTINFPLANNFKSASPSVSGIIGNIDCDSYTAGPAGLSMGYQELTRVNEPGALNVIVFFTDGIPNTLHMDFPIKRDAGGSPSGVSTCNAGLTTLRGSLTPSGGGSGGLFPLTGDINPPSEPSGMIPAGERTGCVITTTNNADNIEQDLAYLPVQDIFGNSINGFRGAPPVYTSGPYAGKYRVNSSSGLETAAQNALDNAAVRIRSDATLRPVIYSIGLGAVGPSQDELLRRVANDPAATNYDNSKPAGLYAFAPDGNGLTAAFQRIAAEILRLSL